MPASTINQLQSESATWKRLLSFLMEENIHLKNRITEVLQDDTCTRLLAKLEDFQTSFISTDTLVALLRDDVKDFETRLQAGINSDEPGNQNISGELHRMRRNICAAEGTFHQRQASFNHYLSENI